MQSQGQQPPQAGGQSQAPSQGQQAQNQAFLNPPLPPGYGYTGEGLLRRLQVLELLL